MHLLYIKNLASKTIGSFERSAFMAAQQAGLKVTFACNTSNINPQKMAQECQKYGVTLVHIDFDRSPFSFKNVRAYKQLLALMHQNKYDLVHCNTPMGGVVGRLAAHRAKIPYVIYQAHGFHFFKGAPLFNWLCYYPVERFLAHYTDLLITINQEDYQAAQKFPAKKVVLVNGVGIDISHFVSTSDKKPILRQKWGIAQDATVLLSVGELNKNKNHQAVLEALDSLHNPQLYYVICGSGPLAKKHANFIKQAGLEKNVILAGYQPNIADFYHMADIFVNPSLREGLPSVVMEAMACKLPVLASRIRGHVDLFPNSQLLFNPHNPAEIATCIQKICTNYPTHEIEQNLKHLENFSFPKIVNHMKEIYFQISSGNEVIQ